MRACVVRAMLVAALLPASGGAQTVSLTESEALSRLSPDSPRVRALRSAIEIARAEVLNAGRWPNPRINFDRESVAGVSEVMTTVLQPLPVTGRRRLERESADALVDASAYRSDDAVRRVRADLRIAYADLVAAQARERELTAARMRLENLTGILEKRETAGEAAGFDRLRSEREVIDVEADRAAAAADRGRTQATLAGFFAPGTEPSSLVAEERVLTPRDIPPVDVLVAETERTRGDIRALQQEITSARLALRAAGRRRIPEPELMAGTKSSTAAGGDVGSVISVQAVLPLFDRGRPERALAQAKGANAEARLEALRTVIRADIGAWRAAAIERRNAAARYRAAALSTAAEVERIAQVSYDAGERTILELLDALRTSASARVRQAALDAAAREAEIELEFASGWEIQ
jgi:cobalt-zinc-cadmium efflux system outer membrane protein